MEERAISKSQLESVRQCERIFGFSYLEKVEGESNKFANFGTLVHSQLEGWLAHGRMPDTSEAGLVAESGLHHLPHHTTPGLMVETEVFTANLQAIYHGFGDWIEPPRPLVVIGDHKSTTDFKWAHTEETLEEDIQANIYTKAAMQLYGVDEAMAKWVYYRTRGAKKSHVVQRRMTGDRVERVFLEIIDPLAAKVQDLWEQKPRAIDLTPNYKACGDYGGCRYRSICQPDARSLMKARFAHQKKEHDMGLFADKMKAKLNTAPTETKEEVKKPTVADINPPEGPKTRTAPAKVEQRVSPPETIKEAVKKHVEPATKKPGFILLTNCHITAHNSGGFKLLPASDLIASARALVEAELGVPDWRLVEFGRGPGALCAAMRQLLEDNSQMGYDYIVIDTRTDEGRACFDAFRDFASTVIMGG